MKNLKKLSREELRKVNGGKIPVSNDGGGCEAGHGCACGAIYNNFTPGTPHWDCCSCPPQGF